MLFKNPFATHSRLSLKMKGTEEIKFTSLIQDHVLSENSVYQIILRSLDNTQFYMQYVPIKCYVAVCIMSRWYSRDHD